MLKPAGFRVLIKPEKVEEESEEGIILHYSEEQKELERAGNMKGTIAEIGPIAFKAFGPNHTGEPWASKGDRIYYSKYAGKFIIDPETEEQFIICNDEDIVALIGEGENNE